MNAEQNDSLFTVHVRPVVAATVLAVGIVLLLISAEGLFFHALVPADLHVAVRVILWILFVVAVITTIVGLKQIVRPVRIFEVTRNGILQYMRAGIALEDGQLIPWDRVESMELAEKSGYHGRHSRIIVVAARLRVDDEWPKQRLYNFDEAEHSVYLDAFSGDPAGKPLLDKLVEAKTRFGPV
jgi:hypothetical protein